jgi:hypothetical protein
MASITKPEKAVRLARAIASDISLYNEERIIEAIENDTFFEALADELEEGRTLYVSRVDESIRSTSNFYERAIVDIILRTKGQITSSIW